MWRLAQKEFYLKLNSTPPRDQNNESEIKSYWRTIKTIYWDQKHIGVPTPTLFDSTIAYDSGISKEKVLNAFFTFESTLDLDSAPILPSVVSYCTPSRLGKIYISSTDIFNLLQSSDVNTATGPDSIGNIVLRSCARSLCTPISLHSKSIRYWRFSNSMEISSCRVSV